MLIEAKIKPNSKESKVELEDKILKISVKSAPEDNEANKEIIKLLNNIFGRCEIVRGLKSRNKLINLPVNGLFEVKTRLTPKS